MQLGMHSFSEKPAKRGALWTFLCLCCALVCAAGGMYSCIAYMEDNRCSMTYMWPNYVHIHTADNGYSLFLYLEGYNVRAVSLDNLHGIPVLFVPGNSGSYKQVRSLASEAARAFAGHPSFDFFAADFDEELSGLSGTILQAQTEYVNSCIRTILELYSSTRMKNPPTSVLLIGHSMGGLVARATFFSPGYVHNSVHTILTLSTPHWQPPILISRTLPEFYSAVNRFWSLHSTEKKLTGPLEDVLVVSIGGGGRDMLVHASLVDLAGLPDANRVMALTPSIPSVQVEADHKCILWCNEVVKVITHCLGLIVSDSSGQIIKSLAVRKMVFEDALSSPLPALFGLLPSRAQSVGLAANITSFSVASVATLPTWTSHTAVVQRESLQLVLKFDVQHWLSKGFTSCAIMTSMAPRHSKLWAAFLADNDSDSVSVLTQATPLLPSALSLMHLREVDLRGHQHLLLVFSADAAELPYSWFCLVQFFGATVFEFEKPPVLPVLSASMQVSADHAMMVNMSFPLTANYYAYDVVMSVLDCNIEEERFVPLLYMFSHALREEKVAERGAVDGTWRMNRDKSLHFDHLTLEAQLRFHQVDPSRSVSLMALVDPVCSFEVKVRLNIFLTIAQVLRQYAPMVLPLCSVVVLSAMYHQLGHCTLYGEVPSLTTGISAHLAIRPLPMLATAACVMALSTHFWVVAPIFHFSDLHPPYPPLWICVLMYCMAVSVVLLMHLLLTCAFSTAHLCCRNLTRTQFVTNMSESFLVCLLAAGIVVGLIAHHAVGELILLVVMILRFALHMVYNDHLSAWNYHKTLTLLYANMVLLDLPSLIVWFRDPHFFSLHPSIHHLVLLVLALQASYNPSNSFVLRSGFQRPFITVSKAGVFILCLFSVYRTLYFLLVTCLFIFTLDCFLVITSRKAARKVD